MDEMGKTREQLAEELKQAQERIAELEAAANNSRKISSLYHGIFENFMDSATESFSIWDSNLNLTYINNANLKYLTEGTKKSDVIGKNIKEMIPGIEQTGRYEKYRRVLETGEPLIIEDSQKDAVYGDTYLSIKVFKISDGIGIISSDITERKHMEQALQESQQRLSVLIDKAPDIIFSYDINGRFISGNKRAEELMGYQKGEMIGKTFAESGMFTPESLSRAMQRLENYKQGMPSRPTPYELIAKDGSHLFVEVMGMPIVQEDKIEIIAVARDITERKRIEEQLNEYKKNLEKMVDERTAELAGAYEELRESEERLRAFFENVPDILFGHDMTGKVTAVNKRGLELSGYSREEIIGKNFLEAGILPQDQIQGVMAAIKGLDEGRSGYPYEVQLIRKDGSRLTLEAVSFPIKKKGAVEIMGIARDITERKRMEEALRDSEAKLRVIYDSIGDGIIVTDLKGKVIDLNAACARLSGYSNKDIIGHNGISFISEQDRDRARSDMFNLLYKGIGTTTEYRLVNRQGKELTAEVSGDLITDIAGKPVAIVAVIRDITERKRIEEALKESETKYRTLVEQSDQGICILQDGHISFANNALTKINGYSLKEMYAMSSDELLSTVYPEDRKIFVNRMKSRLHSDKLMPKYEYKIIRKDGVVRHLETYAKRINYKGQPAIQSTIADITERKQWEEKLSKSKEELRFYLNQITKAQEEERKRIARELHDDTTQELIALSRQLDEFTGTKLKAEENKTKIYQARQKLDSILEGVRRFTRDLRPSVLDDLGLVPALEWLTSDMSSRFGIPINISVIGSERHISPDTALAMFRIAQESLSNAGHHAKASQIQVNLKYTNKNVILSVIDNGKGFTPPKEISSLTKHGKLGIAGIHERAQLIGATLSIKSKRNEGTAITLEVPIKQAS